MLTFLKPILKRCKPIYEDSDCVEYSLTSSQICNLDLHHPSYQTDLDMSKVDAMIESYKKNPQFGRFKNTIVVAIQMNEPKLMYLVDGQHRVEMLKKYTIDYPFKVLFYPIKTDDEMRELFFEMNFDSHKNRDYVSLGADSARIASELSEYYKNRSIIKPDVRPPYELKMCPLFSIQREKTDSRLYTIKMFVDALSPYIKQFTSFSDLKVDLEKKQHEFISVVDFTNPFKCDEDCILENFIFPLKNCNFNEYVMDSNITPHYYGKRKKESTTISHSLKIKVWVKETGLKTGEIKCPVCKSVDICQMTFHCGHIVARSKGGGIGVDNLRPICGSCNSSMGTQNMDDFIKRINYGI
jgi:hypothetical protein